MSVCLPACLSIVQFYPYFSSLPVTFGIVFILVYLVYTLGQALSDWHECSAKWPWLYDLGLSCGGLMVYKHILLGLYFVFQREKTNKHYSVIVFTQRLSLAMTCFILRGYLMMHAIISMTRAINSNIELDLNLQGDLFHGGILLKKNCWQSFCSSYYTFPSNIIFHFN